jgi:6-phosphofructo-2-kinase/fructose-2,6-biphosphatase
MYLNKYYNRLADSSFLSLTYLKAMPEAAGAVAAAAVADRLHGSKEDRKLAIVLVN